MNAHYVYKITNLNPVDDRQFYIGVRTAPSGNPEEDTEYMGSSDHLKEAIGEQGLEFFSKEILSIWETRELAEQEEVRLHWEINVAKNPQFYNKVNARIGEFCPVDHVAAFDTIQGITTIVSKDEFYQNDNLVGIVKNKVTVRNKITGQTSQIPKDQLCENSIFEHVNKNKVLAIDTRSNKTVSITKEEFDSNNFYVGVGKNTITVFDKTTAKSKRVTKEEFDSNSNLVAVSKHSVTVIDLRDKSTKRVSLEDFKNCEYYIHPTAYKISIFDDNDNLVTTIYKDFIAHCKKMGYPEKWLRWSYMNDGQKIYQQEMTPGNKLQAERKGYLRFKGWSAITEPFK